MQILVPCFGFAAHHAPQTIVCMFHIPAFPSIYSDLNYITAFNLFAGIIAGNMLRQLLDATVAFGIAKRLSYQIKFRYPDHHLIR